MKRVVALVNLQAPANPFHAPLHPLHALANPRAKPLMKRVRPLTNVDIRLVSRFRVQLKPWAHHSPIRERRTKSRPGQVSGGEALLKRGEPLLKRLHRLVKKEERSPRGVESLLKLHAPRVDSEQKDARLVAPPQTSEGAVE